MGDNMDYRNYVFDLYGTLIDVRTDEWKPSLWKRMAALYAVYGAEYRWAELREAYFRAVGEAEDALRARGAVWPEIRLEDVFFRLLTDRTGSASGVPDPDTWLRLIANVFRVLSRERLRLYPGTLPALDALRQGGCRLFLLSNAQAAFTGPELAACGLTSYFEGLYLSSDFGVKKPEGAFLRRLLEDHALDPDETVMIGNDAASDMAVADACGLDSVLLNTAGETETAVRERIAVCGLRSPERVRVLLRGDLRELAELG